LMIAQILLAMSIKAAADIRPAPRVSSASFEESDFPLVGSWYGYIEEPRIGTYNARLDLYNDRRDRPSGRVAYTPFGCRTIVSFIDEADGEFRYQERHDSGQCMEMKVISLKPDRDGTLRWTSVKGDGMDSGKGVFKPAQP
jgi:hypothetical protein